MTACTTSSCDGSSGKVKALKIGDGMRDDSQVGPLIDGAALARIEAMVAQAVRRGREGGRGRAAPCGGPELLSADRADRGRSGMDICGDEILGPVASVMRFSEEAEALTPREPGAARDWPRTSTPPT